MDKRERFERTQKFIVVGVIAFAVIVVFLAIVFPAISGGMGSSAGNIVSVPRVSTVVSSSKDGSTYSVRAKFSIELAEGSKAKVDAGTLQGKITDIMGTLDYDRMNEDGADLYIKENIENGLSGYIDPSEIQSVYITEFQSGDSLMPLDEPDGSQRDNVLRGLFRNMK